MLLHAPSISRSPCAASPRLSAYKPYCRAPCTVSASTNCSHRHQVSSIATISTAALRSVKAARVICNDAPRPMWAAKVPPPEPGRPLERTITLAILESRNLRDLSDVYAEWGPSFTSLNAAAAVVRYSKLSRKAPDSSLQLKLLRLWLKRLPESAVRQCANVLWAVACTGAGSPALLQQVWEPTWDAYIGYVQKALQNQFLIDPQEFSSVLWACAKLSKPPAPDDLQLLLESFVRPDVLKDATSQALANVIWALGKLSQLNGSQSNTAAAYLPQLLGPEQVQKLVMDGTAQPISNVMVALSRLSTGSAPPITVDFAQEAAKQLLDSINVAGVRTWTAQQVANVMWACAGLGLPETVAQPFLAAAVTAAPKWLPGCGCNELRQVLHSTVMLQLLDEGFMTALLQRALQQQQQQEQRQPSRKRPAQAAGQAADSAHTAALCGWVVAVCDMRALAGSAKAVIAGNHIAKQPNIHPANLRRLYVFHSWLLEQQLLDGKGLAGLVTEQQLREGRQQADSYK